VTVGAAPLGFGFDADHRHRTAEERCQLLGGKGAGLAVMTAMGLPVPPGFTLTTEACRRYLASGWSDELDAAVRRGLDAVEAATGARLGDPDVPLLVSVRSGAARSMPGMLGTVLDVGMSDEVADGLARRTGDAAFARDTHRRSLLSHAEIVAGAPAEVREEAATVDDVDGVRAVLEAAGLSMPADPVEQVVVAVRAVFDSWTSERAHRYRRVEGIDESLGTAATVQAMVFGNLGDGSGTGVAFSRDPSSGAPGLMGDFLVRAQGEDVVAGTHVTRPLAEMATRWPDAWTELVRIAELLEHHHTDMVDIELTVEEGTLWVLQARPGKRSPIAELRIAIDLAEDPAFPVDRSEAVARCRHLLDDPPTIVGTAGDSDDDVIAVGLAAAPGRAIGTLCLDVDRAVEAEAAGTDVVLVRRQTSPADVHGIAAARGLVTTLGGLVSHAAVVARSWGLPAVVGAADLHIADGRIHGPGGEVAEGEVVTVDGDRGRLLRGAHHDERSVPPEVDILRRWAGALEATVGSEAETDGST